MIQKETKYNLYNDDLNIHRVHMSEGMFFRVANLFTVAVHRRTHFTVAVQKAP